MNINYISGIHYFALVVLLLFFVQQLLLLLIWLIRICIQMGSSFAIHRPKPTTVLRTLLFLRDASIPLAAVRWIKGKRIFRLRSSNLATWIVRIKSLLADGCGAFSFGLGYLCINTYMKCFWDLCNNTVRCFTLELREMWS